MKKIAIYFTIVLAIVFFAGCQKELQLEFVPNTGLAEGTLKSTSGNCLPSSVSGTYTKDSVLKISNFIEVTVDITAIGNYIIKSDTIDGFSFIGIGMVTNTGLNSIKLLGQGIPTSVGIKLFTVKFGASSCKIPVSVVAGSTSSNAVFSITNCGSPVLSGPAYSVGTATTALNAVTFNVNVTNAGLYSITSNANNALTFSASGTYSSIGSNTLILTASGTPTAEGTFQYTINTGTSSCTFSITVTSVPPPPPVNLDYIPMTTNSNWTNKIIPAPAPPALDTIFLQVSPNSKTFGTNSYKIFERKTSGNPTDSTYFRGTGGKYFQYISDRIGTINAPINKEYMVLDSNLSVNSTWNSFIAATLVLQGFTITNVNIDAKIIAKGATQTVQGITYSNVIRVQYTYNGSIIGLPTVLATEDRFYAKGIGMISSNITSTFTAGILTEVTRSQIF